MLLFAVEPTQGRAGYTRMTAGSPISIVHTVNLTTRAVCLGAGRWKNHPVSNSAVPSLEPSNAVNMNHFLDEENILAFDIDFRERCPSGAPFAQSSLPALLAPMGWSVDGLWGHGGHFLPVTLLKALDFPLETRKVPFPRVEHGAKTMVFQMLPHVGSLERS